MNKYTYTRLARPYKGKALRQCYIVHPKKLKYSTYRSLHVEKYEKNQVFEQQQHLASSKLGWVSMCDFRIPLWPVENLNFELVQAHTEQKPFLWVEARANTVRNRPKCGGVGWGSRFAPRRAVAEIKKHS